MPNLLQENVSPPGMVFKIVATVNSGDDIIHEQGSMTPYECGVWESKFIFNTVTIAGVLKVLNCGFAFVIGSDIMCIIFFDV